MSKQSVKRLTYLIIYTFNQCYSPLKDREELAIRQGVVYVLFTICPKYIRMIMIKSTPMCNSQNNIPSTLQNGLFRFVTCHVLNAQQNLSPPSKQPTSKKVVSHFWVHDTSHFVMLTISLHPKRWSVPAGCTTT